MGTSKFGVYAGVVLAMVFWGFTFVVFKFANQSFNPISIVFIRLVIASFFLFGFAFFLNRLNRIKKKDFRWFILLAFFEPFIYFLGEAYGLTMVSSTVGAVIVSTIPLFLPYASWIFFREKLSALNKIGLVVSFIGVLMVIMVKSDDLTATPKGVLLMFLAVVAAIGYTMVAKKLTEDYNPLSITAYQGLIGMIFFLPLFLFIDLPGLDMSAVSPISLYAVLYLGVVGSGICFILLTIAMRELGAAKANIFANLVPVVAAYFSFLILKESMPLVKVLGIIIVILGLFMTQIEGMFNRRANRKRDFRHPPYS
ncbi:MAG: DMT family transporter [Bacteroidales bacterium]|nr:DMT family transporter [Bacteroidales bacterium]